MTAYYNEFDPYAAQWLRNLIEQGLIASGDVDERSIIDVQASDLVDYSQCHFFAGIGGWPLALRMAGWPDDRPIWSGSCPCQPYSVASVAHGGAKGQGDERHLAPTFCSLIGQCSPPVVVGEQVVSAIGWGWLDELFWDLESEGYACASAIVPASGVGASHKRERLIWLADARGEGREGHQHRDSVPIPKGTSLSIDGSPFVAGRRALAGDYGGLLLSHGIPVGVERSATKGYGNAIVPQVAAEVMAAFMEARP